MLVRCYRDLLVWQKAVDLVTGCYALTKLLPKSETYGLASQMQRASVSIPANIASTCAADWSSTFATDTDGSAVTDTPSTASAVVAVSLAAFDDVVVSAGRL